MVCKIRKRENYDLDYEESRKIIYGMTYFEWKSKYQSEATKEQVEQFKKNSLDDREIYELNLGDLLFYQR